MEHKSIKASPAYIRNFFFWSGIVATFCYRAIVVVSNYSHFWAQLAWYLGTVGFILYFYHRYVVSEKRANLIKKYDLIKKIQDSKNLSRDEIDASEYILKTLVSTKEKWNYIFIFITSVIAIVMGVYLDFIK